MKRFRFSKNTKQQLKQFYFLEYETRPTAGKFEAQYAGLREKDSRDGLIRILEDRIGWSLTQRETGISDYSKAKRNQQIRNIKRALVTLTSGLQQDGEIDIRKEVLMLIDLRYRDKNNMANLGTKRRQLLQDLNKLDEALNGLLLVKHRRPKDDWTSLILTIVDTTELLLLRQITKKETDELLNFVFQDLGFPDRSTITAIENAWPIVKLMRKSRNGRS